MRWDLPVHLPACHLLSSPQVGVGLKVYRHPAGAFEQRQLIATVRHRRPLAPAWIHDFPATATHAVLPEMPLYFNVGAACPAPAAPYNLCAARPIPGCAGAGSQRGQLLS